MPRSGCVVAALGQQRAPRAQKTPGQGGVFAPSMPLLKFQTVGRERHRHGRVQLIIEGDVQTKKLCPIVGGLTAQKLLVILWIRQL